MITEAEIFARLTALHSALVHKLGAQPWAPPSLLIDDRSCCVMIYDKRPYRSDNDLHTARADTIAACIADAEAFVAAMPDPEAKAKHDWHRKLGDVIDQGHALALPDEVMKPLRQGSQAMTENLLTHEAAE